MQFSFTVKAGSANYLFSVILGDRLCHTCDPTAWFLTGCSVSHIKVCLWSAVSTKQEAPQLLSCTCKINRDKKMHHLWRYRHFNRKYCSESFLSQCWI